MPDLSQADGIQLAITPRGNFSCVTVNDLEVARNERHRSANALLAAVAPTYQALIAYPLE